MGKARRKRRWLVWACGAGLPLTLAAAGFSEFRVVSYRQATGGVPSRFVLSQSGITVVYRMGNDELDWFGREMFDAGWSVPAVRQEWRRVWTPALSWDKTAAGRLLFFRLPLWMPALLLGAGLVWGLRSGWTGANICGRCGYDLSGSAGRGCSECGAGVEVARG